MRIVVTFLLFGCSSPGKPTAAKPASPTCEQAAHNFAEVVQGRVEDTYRDAAKRAYHDIALRRCREDGWPQVAIDCVARDEDPFGCFDKLDEQQVQSVESEMGEWETKNVEWSVGEPVPGA